MQAPANLKELELKIGDYELHSVPCGRFGLDGGAMFGTIPKTLWEKSNPADEFNRIELQGRALLAISPTEKVLIDTGVGSDFIEKYGEKAGSKFAQIYGVRGEDPDIHEILKKHGLTVEDITKVFLTHLHFDHAGGATCSRDGEIVPTFPNATYFVQKKNLETALEPNIRERASYLPANIKPLLDHKVLEVINGPDSTLLEGFSFFISNGHTQGLQVVQISHEKHGIAYCADLIPTSTHVRLPFVMGYDLHPLMVIEEKKLLMQMAIEKNWYLYFEHDPRVELAQVETYKESDFQIKQGFTLK
jgi:glyoxylase-like metal-dependent hydrolase (beta-lactamase superfamily II)